MSDPDNRLFPARPILAVSTAVFRDGLVLLARRTRAPFRGAYSLPGGVVEIGETLAQAAARELMEEVGVTSALAGVVDIVEPIERDGERVRAHFAIVVHAARWLSGEPKLSEEVDDVQWVAPEESDRLPTTPELPRLVQRAARLIDGAP